MSKFLALSVIVLSVAAFADDMEHIRQARRYGADTQIEVTVVHEDGSPVAGAEVKGIFPSVWNRSPAKVIMLNAAIPSEALDAAAFNTEAQGNGLVPDDWKNYDARTWCSCWHQLFEDTDRPQKALTWKNRFSKLLEQDVLNLYSTGDEVLEVLSEEPSIWSDWSFSAHSWQAQELNKGRGGSYGSDVAGWEFREEKPSPQVANALAKEELQNNPVFEIDARMMDNSISANNRNTLLAHGIPALSCPIGNPMQHTVPQASRAIRDVNLNDAFMQPNGWRHTEGEDASANQWLHSDIKNMDYFHTWRAFKIIVDELR